MASGCGLAMGWLCEVGTHRHPDATKPDVVGGPFDEDLDAVQDEPAPRVEESVAHADRGLDDVEDHAPCVSLRHGARSTNSACLNTRRADVRMSCAALRSGRAWVRSTCC